MTNTNTRMFSGSHVLSATIVCVCLTSSIHAQTRFELVAPQSGVSSRAELVADTLAITDAQGVQTVYRRDRTFDSADGAWLGFHASRPRQVLRWPASSSGSLQIGQFQPGGTVSYRSSQMTIRSLGGSDRGLVLPPDGLVLPPEIGGGSVEGGPVIDSLSKLLQGRHTEPRMLRFSTVDDRGESWVLARQDATRPMMVRAAAARNADWFVVPVSRGFVRLQHYDRGIVSVLAAAPNRGLVMEPIAQDMRQLWQIAPCPQTPGRFTFENAAHRGFALGGGAGNNFGLQPIALNPQQMWMPLAPAIIAPIEPFWRSVNTQVRPNPPLDPAKLDLVNSHRYALIVLIGDRRSSNAPAQLRIEPNSTSEVTLERDAGATLIETIEIRSPFGIWDQQQLVTPIPPVMIYDLSVYEEFLQSIAIDRTGTSPNPIEDVNYVPKSVGWIPVPPGDALPVVSRLDVYSRAQTAKNPGAVRRFDPKSFDKKPRIDPLQSILDDVKPKDRKKF